MARLTDQSICSVCFIQDPTKRHVDFDAATDRGWYGEGHTVPIDWIIICEDCLIPAATLLGMTDDEGLKQELVTLRGERETYKREASKAQEYLDRLEDAFDHREKPVKIDHRRRPRKTKEPQEA